MWECPSLVSLKDESGADHDILIVSENGDSKGSLMQYFVGKFNGENFVSDDATRATSWVDHGPDNYAAVPYHNDPKSRPVIIGWMSNWLYAANTPTAWRGQMTIPRVLGLKTVNEKIYLTQTPIEELAEIKDSTKTWSLPEPQKITGQKVANISSSVTFETGPLIQLEYETDLDTASDGTFEIRLGNYLGEYVSFYYNLTSKTYGFDRSHSGRVDFNARFANESLVRPRIQVTSALKGQIILDTASVEIFADDGLDTFSGIFYPTIPFKNVLVIGDIKAGEDGTEKSVTLKTMTINVLKGIWKK